MLLYVLFNVFAVAGLLVGAMGAQSASKAHRRTAEVLRQMQATWEAIGQAQQFNRAGRHVDANRELDRAAQVILASRPSAASGDPVARETTPPTPASEQEEQRG